MTYGPRCSCCRRRCCCYFSFSLTLSGHRHFFRIHVIIGIRSLACILIFSALLNFISIFLLSTHMHCWQCCSCLFSVFTFVYICFASHTVCVRVDICCFSFSGVLFCNESSAWCSIVVIMCYITIPVRWLKSPCNCETTGAHTARFVIHIRSLHAIERPANTTTAIILATELVANFMCTHSNSNSKANTNIPAVAESISCTALLQW